MIIQGDPRFKHLETKIGLFVALALAGCLAVVFFIGAESDLFTAKYRLRFTVDKGTGFATGMPIKLSGFRIGRVQSIALNEQAQVDVVIQIGQKYRHWVRKDSYVKLIKEGLVGDAIIEINAGSPDSPELDEGDSIAYEKTKTIEEHVEGIADKVTPVLLEIRDIIGYINNPQGDIKQTLVHLNGFSRDLEVTRGKTDRLLDQTTAGVKTLTGKSAGLVDQAGRSFQGLDAAVVKLDHAIATIDEQLPLLLTKLDLTLANLQQISADLSQASGAAAPRLTPLVEQVEGVVRETGSLVGAAQEVWPLKSHLPTVAAPKILPGDSHE